MQLRCFTLTAAASLLALAQPARAEVIQLIGPVVTQLLKQAGISADGSYIQSLISAVVAILNVQQMPGAPAAAA